jgi:hypothetical protein
MAGGWWLVEKWGAGELLTQHHHSLVNGLDENIECFVADFPNVRLSGDMGVDFVSLGFASDGKPHAFVVELKNPS